MKSKLLTCLSLLLLPAVLHAQMSARQATGEEAKQAKQAAPQTEVPSPMLLEVSLAGDGSSKPHIVDMPFDRTRLLRDTAAYVCDKMTVDSIALKRRKARKGKIELVVMPTLRTEHYRQKVNVSLALLGAEGKELRSWVKRSAVLGLSAGEVIGGGAIGMANPGKTWSEEVVWEFESEEQLREQLGTPDAKIRIVTGIIE
jgi:hypothetical protein